MSFQLEINGRVTYPSRSFNATYSQLFGIREFIISVGFSALSATFSNLPIQIVHSLIPSLFLLLVVTVIYLLLSYCLIVAYLAKASEVLDFFAGNTLPPAVAGSVLCISIAGLFLIGGPDATDKTNQFLTSALLILFVGILGVGITQNDVVGSLASSPGSWTALSPSIPIIFLSLVYHDLVPVICSYLGGDRKLVRSALILGSLVPLGMFLSWEAVALSLVPQGLVASALDPMNAAAGANLHSVVQEVTMQVSNSGNAAVGAVNSVVSSAQAAINSVAISGGMVDGPGAPLTVDPLQVFVRRSGPVVGFGVQIFSFLAVITSFTATVVGLSETMRAELPPMIREIGRRVGSEAMMTYDTETSTDIEDTSNNTSEVMSSAAYDGPLFPNIEPGRVIALALTLGPPLAFTAENPGAFLAVLSIAGGYGMTTLYGVLPPLMVWKLRAAEESKNKDATGVANGGGKSQGGGNIFASSKQQQKQEKQKQGSLSSSLPSVEPLMPGGIPVLASVLAAAVGIGLSRVVADADGALEVVSNVAADAAALMAPTVEVVAHLAAMAPPGITL